MAIVNFFLVYREVENLLISQKEFRRHLDRGPLINSNRLACEGERNAYLIPASVKNFNVGAHNYALFQTTKRRCEVCSKGGGVYIESRPTAFPLWSHLCCNGVKKLL